MERPMTWMLTTGMGRQIAWAVLACLLACSPHRPASRISPGYLTRALTPEAIDRRITSVRREIAGRFVEGESGTEKRAAIFIGPEFGSVTRPDLVDVAGEAADGLHDPCALPRCSLNRRYLWEAAVAPLIDASLA